MVKQNNFVDTIVAQATPPGRGGIAIIRVSGPLVTKVTHALFNTQLTPRKASYQTFCDENGDVIDEGIAVFFSNPHSFTGEDVLELHGHGSPIVVDLLLQRIIKVGARLARPGEFSERAFLNGKMDLTQAEAIADLIDASSAQAARLAMRSLQGEFSKTIYQLTEKIIQLRMYLEAAIDFTDEEIDFLSDATIAIRLRDLISLLAQIMRHAEQGSFLREGITAVIVGEPNVGKSSLINCLSGKELAIVTPIPGTTRDVLRDYILIDDMPMHIIDTAGLRDSDDMVEQEGIKRAYQEIEKADLVLYVTTSQSIDAIALEKYKHKKIIFIRNKIDLLNEQPSIQLSTAGLVVSLSAKTFAGIDLLKQTIKKQVGFENNSEGIFLARRRHLDALINAHGHLEKAQTQLSESRSLDLAAEDLRLAQQALNSITGEFSADDLLGRIFSSFCIGK